MLLGETQYLSSHKFLITYFHTLMFPKSITSNLNFFYISILYFLLLLHISYILLLLYCYLPYFCHFSNNSYIIITVYVSYYVSLFSPFHLFPIPIVSLYSVFLLFFISLLYSYILYICSSLYNLYLYIGNTH